MTSEWFSLPRRVYERYVAMRWLQRRWWLIASPVAVAAVASAVLADGRWLLVALMYLFIIGPGIVSIAYFRYLLTPEARLTALEKRLTIKPGMNLHIEYRTDDEEDDWLPTPETIPWDEVTAIRLSGTNYVIELKIKRWPRFIIVPRKALPAPLTLM